MSYLGKEAVGEMYNAKKEKFIMKHPEEVFIEEL